MNVRTALLYRKNLATLIEESVRSQKETSAAEYSSSPGYRLSSAKYTHVSDRCCPSIALSTEDDVLRLWLLGGLQVSQMRYAVL